MSTHTGKYWCWIIFFLIYIFGNNKEHKGKKQRVILGDIWLSSNKNRLKMDNPLEIFAQYAFCLDNDLAILVLWGKKMKQNYGLWLERPLTLLSVGSFSKLVSQSCP